MTLVETALVAAHDSISPMSLFTTPPQLFEWGSSTGRTVSEHYMLFNYHGPPHVRSNSPLMTRRVLMTRSVMMARRVLMTRRVLIQSLSDLAVWFLGSPLLSFSGWLEPIFSVVASSVASLPLSVCRQMASVRSSGGLAKTSCSALRMHSMSSSRKHESWV
jgi:hypothetical protein